MFAKHATSRAPVAAETTAAHRENELQKTGWDAICGALGHLTRLERLDQLAIAGLAAGCMSELQASGQDDGFRRSAFDRGAQEAPAGPALVRFLTWSASCLTKLDLRLLCATSQRMPEDVGVSEHGKNFV